MSRHGILFDLDGTLADTAPDLVAVLNRMLLTAGRPPVPYAIARNEVSNGALGLIRLGFGLAPNAPVEPRTRQSFLDLYQRMGHINSRLFLSLSHIIYICSELRAGWGIVTNKPAALTESLLEHLGIRTAVQALVCGDTLAQKKPHPAPLEHAAAELGLACDSCVYLGDAERDIRAGRAAGMKTLATSYGYIRPGESVATWHADAVADHPRKIHRMLQQILTYS